MLFPAVTGLGVPVIGMATTVADATTDVVTVAVLLLELLSCVLLETTAELVMVEPLGVLELTWTTMVNVAEAPAAKVESVPLIVPVPPAGGLVNVKVTPLFWVSDTKVVLAGMAPVSFSLFFPYATLFRSVMV